MKRILGSCLTLLLLAAATAGAIPGPSEEPGKRIVAAPLGWQPWQTPPGQGAESTVRFYTSAQATFVELDLGPIDALEPIAAAHLDDPPRAFFDVAFQGTAVPGEVTLATAQIAGIRFGVHRSSSGRSLRCVIDLQGPAVRIRSVQLRDGKLFVEAAAP